MYFSLVFNYLCQDIKGCQRDIIFYYVPPDPSNPVINTKLKYKLALSSCFLILRRLRNDVRMDNVFPILPLGGRPLKSNISQYTDIRGINVTFPEKVIIFLIFYKPNIFIPHIICIPRNAIFVFVS